MNHHCQRRHFRGRRALKQLITYIGLDVHKETIAVALAEAGKRNEVREYGKIANTPAAMKVLVAKLARNGHELRFCYEAGPCGYGIQRQLTASKHDCIVVAPSLIPRRPGERIKTDRRDAINLAKLHRRCAIWCGRVWPQCGHFVKLASNFPASCCAMVITTTDQPGR